MKKTEDLILSIKDNEKRRMLNTLLKMENIKTINFKNEDIKVEHWIIALTKDYKGVKHFFSEDITSRQDWNEIKSIADDIAIDMNINLLLPNEDKNAKLWIEMILELLELRRIKVILK